MSEERFMFLLESENLFVYLDTEVSLKEKPGSEVLRGYLNAAHILFARGSQPFLAQDLSFRSEHFWKNYVEFYMFWKANRDLNE